MVGNYKGASHMTLSQIHEGGSQSALCHWNCFLGWVSNFGICKYSLHSAFHDETQLTHNECHSWKEIQIHITVIQRHFLVGFDCKSKMNEN